MLQHRTFWLEGRAASHPPRTAETQITRAQMPSNKNQHFLPQHYLRLFSVDNGRNIGISRISPIKFVVGPIKGQCQSDWFYRHDGQLDEWLQETESAYGELLPMILATRRLTNEQLVACRFLAALFSIRTKKAAEIHGLLSRRMFFDVVNDGIQHGKVPPPPPDWSMDTVGVNGVSGFLVKNTLLQCFFEMATLECKLLHPTGHLSFVTSDHPAVCMNQIFAEETSQTGRSYAGFSRSGFQLVLPLSPKLCLFFYDAKVYKVGNRRNHLVGIIDDDVEILNGLQVQNADSCVYSGTAESGSQMSALIEKFSSFRVPVNDLLKVHHQGDASLYHIASPSPKLHRLWSFCKRKQNPSIPDSRRRNQAWTEVVSAFIRHLDKVTPEDTMEEFCRFVENYR